MNVHTTYRIDTIFLGQSSLSILPFCPCTEPIFLYAVVKFCAIVFSLKCSAKIAILTPDQFLNDDTILFIIFMF